MAEQSPCSQKASTTPEPLLLVQGCHTLEGSHAHIFQLHHEHSCRALALRILLASTGGNRQRYKVQSLASLSAQSTAEPDAGRVLCPFQAHPEGLQVRLKPEGADYA